MSMKPALNDLEIVRICASGLLPCTRKTALLNIEKRWVEIIRKSGWKPF